METVFKSHSIITYTAYVPTASQSEVMSYDYLVKCCQTFNSVEKKICFNFGRRYFIAQQALLTQRLLWIPATDR